MENQIEKNMENEMETGWYRDLTHDLSREPLLRHPNVGQHSRPFTLNPFL